MPAIPDEARRILEKTKWGRRLLQARLKFHKYTASYRVLQQALAQRQVGVDRRSASSVGLPEIIAPRASSNPSASGVKRILKLSGI